MPSEYRMLASPSPRTRTARILGWVHGCTGVAGARRTTGPTDQVTGARRGPRFRAVSRAEIHHEHRSVTGGAARAAVFGVSDGLVSNVSLILGFAGSGVGAGVGVGAAVGAGDAPGITTGPGCDGAVTVRIST